MPSNKNYVGRGWRVEFKDGGSLINISLKKDELDKLPVNAFGDIKLVVGKRREPDEKSKATHWVAEDTYKKDVPF